MLSSSNYGQIIDAVDVLKSDSTLVNFSAFRNADAVAANIRVLIKGSGRDFTFRNVQPGDTIICPVIKIFATNTTAVSVTGLTLA